VLLQRCFDLSRAPHRPLGAHPTAWLELTPEHRPTEISPPLMRPACSIDMIDLVQRIHRALDA
jgi:hypothetical protein